MEATLETVVVNGKTYTLKTDDNSASSSGTEVYHMVRSKDAGTFAGIIVSRNGTEVLMKKARRIWYWAGAASLSQLAQEGTKKPKECRFPVEVDEVLLLGVCEIITMTQKAKDSIKAVAVWAA